MKSSKLKKMQMPSDKSSMDLGMPEDQESASDESAEPSDMESAEKDAGMEKPMGPSPELKDVSDDDLMAEIKARGLMDQLNAPEGEAGPEQASTPDYGM